MKLDPMTQQIKQAAPAALMAVAFVAGLAVPEMAMAQDYDSGDAATRVTSFFDNINVLLNVASLAIVTIAIIFAGYQIAFNQKRISEVAPVLIGGFLIGAAAQLARMLLPDDVGAGGAGSSTMLMMDTASTWLT